MPAKEGDDVDEIVYHAWCERDGCDWERKTVDPDPVRVQNLSAWKMAAHGIETGHHKTRHKEVDPDA